MAALQKKDAELAPFSTRTELIVMNQLMRAASRSLEGYQRTANGDKEILLQDEITFNERNIISIILEEKIGLKKLIEFCEFVIGILMMKPEDAYVEITSREKDNWSEYLNDEILPLIAKENPHLKQRDLSIDIA